MHQDRELERELADGRNAMQLVIPVYIGRLFREPAPGLLQFARRKKLHGCAADSRSSERERESLPTWLSDDGDLGNLTAVRDQKVEIIPVRATLPTLKVFKNDEQARFRSHVDLTGDGALLCAKFGSFQNPADS